jgi:Cytochrome P460
MRPPLSHRGSLWRDRARDADRGGNHREGLEAIPDTNGWGYVTFQYDAASDSYKPATNDASVMKKLCHSCHTSGAKARDYVTSYAKR